LLVCVLGASQEMERALEGEAGYGSAASGSDAESTAFQDTGASPYKKLIQAS
jgi:hypothetical protein